MTTTRNATPKRLPDDAPLMLLALLALGCQGQLSTRGTACSVDGDCGASEACVDGRCQGREAAADSGAADAGSPTEIVSLSITPENPVINLPDDPGTVGFSVTAQQRDGTVLTLTDRVEFTIDDASLGTVDVHSGVFTAAGTGGTATLRAQEVGTGASVTTQITVNWHGVMLGDGVTASDPDGFDAATASTDAASAPSVDYPLAGAVMPRNVYPPNVMWTPHHSAGAGDLLARPPLPPARGPRRLLPRRRGVPGQLADGGRELVADGGERCRRRDRF